MRGLSYFFGMVLVLLAACSPDSSRPIIPEKKMVEILTDQYIMQSAFAQKGGPSDDMPTYFYNQLLEKHHCTEAEFDSAIVWYSAHLDVYERVYEEVMERSQAKEDSITPIVAKEAGGE